MDVFKNRYYVCMGLFVSWLPFPLVIIGIIMLVGILASLFTTLKSNLG